MRKILLQRVWQMIQAAQAGEAVHGLFFSSACSSPERDSCMRLAACAPPAALHACACRHTTSLLPNLQLSSRTPPLIPFDLLLPLACHSQGFFFLNCNYCLLVMGFHSCCHGNRVASIPTKTQPKSLAALKLCRVKEPKVSVSQHETDETMKKCSSDQNSDPPGSVSVLPEPTTSEPTLKQVASAQMHVSVWEHTEHN